jgi:hypothetical protein
MSAFQYENQFSRTCRECLQTALPKKCLALAAQIEPMQRMAAFIRIADLSLSARVAEVAHDQAAGSGTAALNTSVKFGSRSRCLSRNLAGRAGGSRPVTGAIRDFQSVEM